MIKGVTIKIDTDKNGNFGNNHGVASPNMGFCIVLSP
jgi:hypothetical protein